MIPWAGQLWQVQPGLTSSALDASKSPSSAGTADTELDSVGGTGDTAPSFPEWLHRAWPAASDVDISAIQRGV